MVPEKQRNGKRLKIKKEDKRKLGIGDTECDVEDEKRISISDIGRTRSSKVRHSSLQLIDFSYGESGDQRQRRIQGSTRSLVEEISTILCISSKVPKFN